MAYTSVSQVPKRRQWEASSSPNQAYNCGPTCASFIADFYNNTTYHINSVRQSVTLQNNVGTSSGQQAAMLIKRGIPATVQTPSAAQLTALVASGRRPVIIGMNMSSVPSAYRGHPFLGVHAVVVRYNATVGGVPGKIIMDPNFDYGHTWDSSNGFRFYPDSIVDQARSGPGANRAAVVPTNPKVVPNVKYRATGPGVNIRKGPGTNFAVMGQGPVTLPFSRTVTGGTYTVNGRTSKQWDEVRYKNMPCYIATLLTRPA